MKRSNAFWIGVVVVSAFGCKERFCVEGLIGAGSDAAQYAKYDCSNFGGGTGVHHYHLGGSSATGGAATGGSISTGGTPATGGAETGGAATGGDQSTGGTTAGEGGSEATGGLPAGGTTSAVPLCSDAESANCLSINQSGGPDMQNISCVSPPAPYGNYTIAQNCPCAVSLGAIFIRTDSATSLKNGSLVFSGAGSFAIDFDIALPPAQNWVTLATPISLTQGSYTVQLVGSICRTDSDPPTEGTGVRMTWDGIKVALSTGLSDQIPLGSYYAVTHTVVAAP